MEHKWPVIKQQKLLALKDLEIMRLREALEIATINNGEGGYLQAEKAKFKKLISILTTYDDLMAWHEAQLGEPVAWLYEREDDSEGWYVVTNYEKVHDNGNRNIECYDIPLYAKKG